jgi:hypothetical protein
MHFNTSLDIQYYILFADSRDGIGKLSSMEQLPARRIIDDPVPGTAKPCFDDLISGSDVLRNVMEFLDESSLKSCRRVSKKWEEEARTILIKHFELGTTRKIIKLESKLQTHREKRDFLDICPSELGSRNNISSCAWYYTRMGNHYPWSFCQLVPKSKGN